MNIKPLLYWVKERELIRQRKLEGLPAPWSNDPILQTYRFCNVRRRDDRVSSWLIKNVLTDENIKYNLRSFLMFSAWCRWINWPPTIAAVMDKGWYPKKRIDWPRIGRFVDRHKGKTWTGAYMIVAPRKPKQKKGFFVAKQVIGTSLAGAIKTVESQLTTARIFREEIWKTLDDCNYWGSFMSGQVVADWGYTSLLESASDSRTWAPQGPGSVRGYNRLMGLPLKTKVDQEAWCRQLQNWRGEVIHVLGPEYADLTMMDVQNQLCEVDKYLRVKNGEGRPRAKYRSETAY